MQRNLLQNVIFAMRVDEIDEAKAAIWLEKLPLKRQDKIAALQCADDKKRSLAAGILLVKAAQLLGLPIPQEKRDEQGKPSFFGEKAKANLSHSGDIVVCALSQAEVGVDIEQVRHFSPALVKKVFTQKEQARLALSADFDTACTQLWTAKESVLKYLGCGLKMPAIKLDIQADGRILGEEERLKNCRLTEYALDGYALTVCAEKSPFSDEIVWINL